jgi:hypothetical protein
MTSSFPYLILLVAIPAVGAACVGLMGSPW